MITLNEILKGIDVNSLPQEHQLNLNFLLDRINLVRKYWAKPLIVTSGYRSLQDHKRIYSTINTKRVAKGLPEISVPMGSKHLSGQALDVLDVDGELKNWCIVNEFLLEGLGLWCEDFNHTPTWVHFQMVSPKSGKRFFIP